MWRLGLKRQEEEEGGTKTSAIPRALSAFLPLPKPQDSRICLEAALPLSCISDLGGGTPLTACLCGSAPSSQGAFSQHTSKAGGTHPTPPLQTGRTD